MCLHICLDVSLDESENLDSSSGGSIPGGMFAGVGQFPSVQREPAKPSTDLPELKYKAHSVLRLVSCLIGSGKTYINGEYKWIVVNN